MWKTTENSYFESDHNVNIRHHLRMAKWARKPPSDQRVKLFLAVLALCLVLFGLDRIFGWPDFLTISGPPRGRIN